MDSALAGALAAILGAVVGGSATVATAWITQRSLSRRERALNEIKRREDLYGDFVSECTRVAIDAHLHGLERPENLYTVFALLSRIRLTSSDTVLAAADRTLKTITDQYFEPNLTVEQMRELGRRKVKTPLDDFAEACRAELCALRELV